MAYQTSPMESTNTMSNGALTLTWTRPSSQPPEASAQEKEAFHFFTVHVVGQLHGPFDPRIWHRQVLPISTTEPAVRHAVIALGSLRQHYSRAQTQSTDQFALQHYSKAMKALQNKIADQQHVPQDLILITCLSFVAFEFQQSGWEQAKSHLDGGLSIIRQLQEKPQSSPPPKHTLDPLVEAFERLDIQMSLFTSERVSA